MNQRIGYARVSTDDQHLDLQRDALIPACGRATPHHAWCGVVFSLLNQCEPQPVAYGAFGYKVGGKLSLVAGYRAMGVDYSHRGFVYDVIQRGPIIGLSYKF